MIKIKNVFNDTHGLIVTSDFGQTRALPPLFLNFKYVKFGTKLVSTKLNQSYPCPSVKSVVKNRLAAELLKGVGTQQAHGQLK